MGAERQEETIVKEKRRQDWVHYKTHWEKATSLRSEVKYKRGRDVVRYVSWQGFEG